MGLVTLLIIASVPLFGGELKRLAALPLRGMMLLPVALALQLLVITIAPDLPRPFTVGTHIVTYVLAATFIFVNRRVAGLPLLAVGAALNGLVIVVNGGTLPASDAALSRAGLSIDPDVFTNSGVLAEPKLAWLGDVFAVPAGIPFANVFSVGDVCILLGATWLLHAVCRRRAQPADLRSTAACRN